MDIKRDEAFEEAYAEICKPIIRRPFPRNQNGEYVHKEIHEAHLMWQQAQKVTVPEGFVLVPMVPSERMINAVRQCYEGEVYLPYSLYSEFVNQAIIERMEAQE